MTKFDKICVFYHKFIIDKYHELYPFLQILREDNELKKESVLHFNKVYVITTREYGPNSTLHDLGYIQGVYDTMEKAFRYIEELESDKANYRCPYGNTLKNESDYYFKYNKMIHMNKDSRINEKIKKFKIRE